MTEDTTPIPRRTLLRTAAGTSAASAAAAGTATAQSAQPDFGGWLQGIDGGYEDLRGNKEVTVEVGASGNGGAFAFAPAGIWVDTGTTVKWEWTGEGGGHNVVADSGPADLDSGAPVSEPGVHYEFTFEKGGITTYFCDPHLSLGMKGAVAVGDDVPTTGGGDGGGSAVPSVPTSAKVLGVSAAGGMAAVLGLTYFFIKYGGEIEPAEE